MSNKNTEEADLVAALRAGMERETADRYRTNRVVQRVEESERWRAEGAQEEREAMVRWLRPHPDEEWTDLTAQDLNELLNRILAGEHRK